jgi:hypothetical protein
MIAIANLAKGVDIDLPDRSFGGSKRLNISRFFERVLDAGIHFVVLLIK